MPMDPLLSCPWKWPSGAPLAERESVGSTGHTCNDSHSQASGPLLWRLRVLCLLHVVGTVLQWLSIGHPAAGVRCVLTDGASHAVDSSELAFKLASLYAFRQVSAGACYCSAVHASVTISTSSVLCSACVQGVRAWVHWNERFLHE